MDTEEFGGEDYPSDWYYHDDVWCECDECEPRGDDMDDDSYRRMQWELAETLERLSKSRHEIKRLVDLLQALQKKSGRRTTKRKPTKGKKR